MATWPGGTGAIAGKTELDPRGGDMTFVYAVGDQVTAKASCGEDGSFHLTNLPPGRYRVVTDPLDQGGVGVSVGAGATVTLEGILPHGK